jgi:hypothetical protein
MNWKSRRVKEILLMIIGGVLGAGYCSTKNDLQRLSTSDLQLRRYELMYCLSMARPSWDKQPLQDNAYSDVKDELEEKEAIEEEITYMIIVTADVGLLTFEISKRELKSETRGSV